MIVSVGRMPLQHHVVLRAHLLLTHGLGWMRFDQYKKTQLPNELISSSPTTVEKRSHRKHLSVLENIKDTFGDLIWTYSVILFEHLLKLNSLIRDNLKKKIFYWLKKKFFIDLKKTHSWIIFIAEIASTPCQNKYRLKYSHKCLKSIQLYYLHII